MSETRIYIKDKLEASGKTMTQIADALGVTLGAVSQWASGHYVPSAKLLPALAAALGCTVDALYREPANKKSSPKQDLTGRNLHAADR